MKRILAFNLCFIALLGLFASESLQAQANLPQASPSAKTMYTIGTTEIEVAYSSPGVKGRTLWGDLVPYNEVWRTGANASTKISFSNDVSINGTAVPAGTYALYTIPTENEWTIIINKNTELWGSDGYEQSDDVVRVKAKPQEDHHFMERMIFHLQPKSVEKGNIGQISLEWGNLTVSFDVLVDVDGQVEKQLEAARSSWRTIMDVASYHREKGEYKKAYVLIEEALEMEEYYYAYYLKGMILADMKNYKEAIKAADKALEVGATHKEPFLTRFNNYKERIVESKTEWSGM